MAEAIRSDEGVYRVLVADIHSGAYALRRKYRCRRHSDSALLTGLALSNMDWLLESFLFIRQ